MSPSLIASIVAGFLVGVVVALVSTRVLWGRRLLHTSRMTERSSVEWASLLQRAVDELKNRQVSADSQRQEAENRASQAEHLSNIILSSVPSGVAMFDREFTLVIANPVAQTLLADYSESMPPEIEALFRRTLVGEEIPYVELDITVDARTIPVSISANRLPEDSGVVMVFTELTELKRLQQRARLMEELADLGQLAAGIAHEFRNVAGVLRNSAQFLQERVEGEGAEAVDDLLRETTRLTNVTEDLLDFARPWDDKVDQVSMDDITLETIQQFNDTFSSTQVDYRLNCGETRVYGRSAALKRIVDNLLRNAIEATESDDPIVVESSLDVRTNGIWYVLKVSDRGRGLPTSDVERLFMPFISYKADGTGMGLPMARKIARLHGGDIKLKDRSGGGTSAELFLPLSP